MFLVIIVILSGCQARKSPKEETQPAAAVIKQIATQVMLPKAEDITLPKISSINYIGKDLWSEELVTDTRIIHMASYMDDSLYLSLCYQGGKPYTDSNFYRTELLKFSNSAQKYLNEKSGLLIDRTFTLCNKIIVEEGNTLFLAGSNSSKEGMKVESYQMASGKTNWTIIGGTRTISHTDGGDYYEGMATDMVRSSDNGVVFISNILDENGVNRSHIIKVNSEGAEIWNKVLPPGGFSQKLIEGDTPDTFLVLSKAIKDSSSSLIKVEEGEIVQTLQLKLNVDSIKKVGKNSFFILGTNHIDEVHHYTPMKFDTAPIVTKIDSALNIIYTYTNADFNRLADFTLMGENVYLFVGNQGLTTVVAAFYDSGKTLELIKKESYANMGQPSQIIQRELKGETEYVMSGLNYENQGEMVCTYSWIAHLYPLKPALDTLYKEKLDNTSSAKFLQRGDQERTDIAYAIAKHEGNDELMYIRYMKSDENYSFVITGEWYNSQIINQYLLKNEGGQWQVVKKFSITDRLLDQIKLDEPNVPSSILPPFEVADYVVKVLNDEQLKTYIALADPTKLIGDISFCSYIGDYFYIMFEDGSDYLIKYPEKETKEIYTIKPWIPYNYYLIDDEKPPYFLFMQN